MAVGYEASLKDYEAKRVGLVALIDAAAPKRKWWQFDRRGSGAMFWIYMAAVAIASPTLLIGLGLMHAKNGGEDD